MKNVIIILWLLIITIAVKHFDMKIFELQKFNFVYALNLSAFAFIVSQIASCWCLVLFDNDMILGNLKKEIMSFVGFVADRSENYSYEIRNNLNYLLKPFFLCEKCTTGNMAFWFYVLGFRYESNIFELIFIIANSIFYTALTAKTWQE